MAHYYRGICLSENNKDMEPQRHSGFGGLELLSRLKEANDHFISYLSNLFLMSVNNLFAKILDDSFIMYLYY